VTIER
jgi:hypothetical protein